MKIRHSIVGGFEYGCLKILGEHTKMTQSIVIGVEYVLPQNFQIAYKSETQIFCPSFMELGNVKTQSF